MNRAPDTSSSRVWARMEPLGYPQAMSNFSTVAAPLLAGFSLSAMVVMTGRPTRGVRGDLAITFFGAAACLLIYALQAGVSAQQLVLSPADRAKLIPEAQISALWMARVRGDQWRDNELALALFRRVRLAYNGGLMALAVALLATVQPAPGDWSLARSIGFAILFGACLIEAVLCCRWPPRVSQWLLPLPQQSQPHPDPDPLDFAEARALIYGESDL